MKRLFLAVITTLIVGLIPTSVAQAHNLTCSTHQSEVRSRSIVARQTGAQCIQKGVNYIRYSKAYGRYVAHQNVVLTGGDKIPGTNIHITVRLYTSGVWWTYFG